MERGCQYLLRMLALACICNFDIDVQGKVQMYAIVRIIKICKIFEVLKPYSIKALNIVLP